VSGGARANPLVKLNLICWSYWKIPSIVYNHLIESSIPKLRRTRRNISHTSVNWIIALVVRFFFKWRIHRLFSNAYLTESLCMVQWRKRSGANRWMGSLSNHGSFHKLFLAPLPSEVQTEPSNISLTWLWRPYQGLSSSCHCCQSHLTRRENYVLLTVYARVRQRVDKLLTRISLHSDQHDNTTHNLITRPM
jgi:hypothetical protein